MSEAEARPQAKVLEFEYRLDAPPEKVWRAVTIPAFREKWLPRQDLADREPVATIPGKEISYRMRDDDPPFLESIVTFRVAPDPDGGTVLRIAHGLADAQLTPRPPVANDNMPVLMRAA
ncbi:SRPBCC family protein [Paenirhodobacter populi]|uniref:Polyketide cyclase n=1 Tax=Paenirhodobacter populi TaxID=2306993 RepID=A0A443JRF7_9RHOB|nr:SRPBCC domain-containing protein [Sinirhodobacter populi]RWR23091.1 polyketide cyclase [Sinirhodobacter populi]